MKKLILVLAMFLALTAAVNAQIFTMNDFNTWIQISPPPPTFNFYAANQFFFTMGAAPGPGPQWQSIQLGHQFGQAGWWGLDLSGYTEFRLIVDNCSGCTRNIMANIFMNTGWTDPQFNEPNKFYESTWTWLKPNEFATLTIDLTGVLYRNHVTAIGVMYGTNVMPVGQTPPDQYHTHSNMQMIGSVHPIPEPGTLFLLGTGLLGVGIAARIRRKRS